ncbi:MAG: PP2C family protein-serine/threonine phosphatase [Planctomycetota bacterium]
MSAPRSSDPAPATRVLIVDDQLMIAEAVRRMLLPYPEIQLHACLKGAEAVAKVAEVKPDVILQDLVMPDADGLELVSEYRKDPSLARTPLIVLSAKEEAATKADAFARGANDYLVKLPDPVELIARIRYHAGANRAQRERDEAFNALRAELDSAAHYVQSLIPEPLDGRVSTRWKFVPSASLGGDSFGYHWLDDHRFAIYLLDVCGHGVGPALLSVSVMNAMQVNALGGADPGDPGAVLASLNEMFPMSKHNGMFFTMWYGVADLAKRELRYGSGGHPPALLLAPGAAPRELGGDEDISGPMIGAFPGMPYGTGTATIPPGSRLWIYSDGIHELIRPDGSLWSLREFLDGVAQEGMTGQGAVDRLVARSRAVRGRDDFEDDVSLLEVVFP